MVTSDGMDRWIERMGWDGVGWTRRDSWMDGRTDGLTDKLLKYALEN